MKFLLKPLLGDGSLTPELRAALESEGLVLLEEGLGGSVRYSHFKAPGKSFNGKVTPVRIGLAISEERFVLYCRSGRTNLIDTPFSSPRMEMLDVSLLGDDKVACLIDYDRGDVPDVSGQVTIRAKTPNAPAIAEELRARLRR